VSNIQKRLVLFFIAFPSLVGIILFLPYGHYAAINILTVLAMGIAALEIGNIFKHHGVRLSGPVVFVLGAAPAAFTYLGVLGFIPERYPVFFYSLAACGLLAREIFHSGEKEFHEVLPRLGAYFFTLMYPGLFGVYVVRITQLPNAGILFMIFIAATYLNDSFAWLTGVLWGKNSRNILAVSPNKSLVGFISGFLASVLVVACAALFLPAYVPLGLPSALLLGSVLGITTILGDLSESSLKRSGVVKDSGTLIPGRGGLLDSIDSPLFSAPVFFYLFSMLAP
jgi:phosphatidate cytidylyltransferase